MKKINILLLISLFLFSACSESTENTTAEPQTSLISPQGVQLAKSQLDLRTKIISHANKLNEGSKKATKLTASDVNVTHIQYYPVNEGVSALIRYTIGNKSTNIVIGRGNHPYFSSAIIQGSSNGSNAVNRGECIEYTASCSGEGCCKVQGHLDTETGSMSFNCTCNDCSLRVLTKKSEC